MIFLLLIYQILLKYTLIAPSDMALRLSFLLFNIAKNNSILDSQFKIPRLYSPFKHDPFMVNADLFHNKVTNSKFWEIILLKRHCISEVRMVGFNLMGKLKESLDFIELENFSKLNLEKLLLRKLKRIKRE